MKPSQNPKAAVAVLVDAVRALEAVGVTSWLTDGTLLGAIRERAFILHDADMDLGAMITEYHPDVIPALVVAGFRLRKTHGRVDCGLEHKLCKDGFNLDIFWYYDTPEGGVVSSAYDSAGRIEFVYDRLVLARLRLLGHVFWAPTPPRLHLVQKYGPAWRTPVVDWDWADDPHNGRRIP